MPSRRISRERLESLLISSDATIREAIAAIDAGAVEIALVTDEERHLLGTLTDGDVRRALLQGVALDDPVTPVIHREPARAPADASLETLLDLMEVRGIEQIPLMEGDRVVDLAVLRHLVREQSSTAPVVVMAGGKGMRLRPLTEDVPKPMLPVGDRPLLDTTVEQVRRAGFKRIMMAVNYRADTIESHFGDGSEHGVNISYVHEPRALGSAGALTLMRDQLTEPFLVMNGDLLTNVNLASLLRFHREEENVVTVGIRQYSLEVPYGVVDIDGTRVRGLREKPTVDFFVNAGIYAASPEVVQYMPPEIGEMNMTDIIEAALAQGVRIGCFPVLEYWLDIGQLSDYERSHADHLTHFAHS